MVRNYKRKTEDRWTKETLLEALMCIKRSTLKINDAAKFYGISRATLYRQYQKFILAGGKYDVTQFRTCGGNPILSRMEEEVLESTIRDLREQGFKVSSGDIRRICFEYCESNGIPNQFNQESRMASCDWYYGFLRRHPNVRIFKTEGDVSDTTATASSSSDKDSKKKQKGSSTKKGSTKADPTPLMIGNQGEFSEVTALEDGTFVIQSSANPRNVIYPRRPPQPKKAKRPAAIILPESSFD